MGSGEVGNGENAFRFTGLAFISAYFIPARIVPLPVGIDFPAQKITVARGYGEP